MVNWLELVLQTIYVFFIDFIRFHPRSSVVKILDVEGLKIYAKTDLNWLNYITPANFGKKMMTKNNQT